MTRQNNASSGEKSSTTLTFSSSSSSSDFLRKNLRNPLVSLFSLVAYAIAFTVFVSINVFNAISETFGCDSASSNFNNLIGSFSHTLEDIHFLSMSTHADLTEIDRSFKPLLNTNARCSIETDSTGTFAANAKNAMRLTSSEMSLVLSTTTEIV